MFDQSVACIDVETTGASPEFDRITEIGIVEMMPDGTVREWSTLVNPQMPIPAFIEGLTGISNAMVEQAPTFAQVADEVLQRLAGRLFVAHNARFDYAFIRNEFRRMERDFRADTLCTVRLSRRLYPQHYKHNLDSLIQRLGIEMEDRHRALADARVLMHFLRRLPQEHDAEKIRQAIGHVMARPALPPHLPEGMVDDIPDTPGVYLFFGDDDLPLHVGRSAGMRSRVMAHFTGANKTARELRLSQQLKRIEWHQTAGELGAMLLEARLVKALQPVNNQRLQRENDLCSWQMVEASTGGRTLVLRYAADIDFGRASDLYGIFASQRKAAEALRSLADACKLCLLQLGLEKPARGGTTPCFGYQVKKCRGACIGKESHLQHDLRLMEALAKLRLQTWPYAGPVAIRETFVGREELHIVDHWAYLGTAKQAGDVEAILSAVPRPGFDQETYRLLTRHLRQPGIEVIPLGRMT
ncbi:excinuclease cho [mine drainage metagenome]|uniref:Excinuclease cho n=1 Tax=mine drainage metagenome TaxID=410659 RepID=A0A1J5RAP9_9ZZZZ